MAARMTAPVSALSSRASSFNAQRVVNVAPVAAGNSCRTITTMAKKGKDVRLVITLECTEQKASGVPGISRYTTQKVSARWRKSTVQLGEGLGPVVAAQPGPTHALCAPSLAECDSPGVGRRAPVQRAGRH